MFLVSTDVKAPVHLALSIRPHRISEHMDPAPRKRAPRVSAEQVSDLLIETVIDLVLTTPIEEITTRSIGEKISMDPQVIFRNFGSLNNLFVAVSKEMGARFSPAETPENFIEHLPVLVPRFKLLTYLLGNGVPGEQLMFDDDATLNAIRSQPEIDGVPTRVANAMAILNIYVLEGFLAFNSIHRFTMGETIDAAQLLSALTANLGSVSKNLDWANNAD